MSAAKGIPIVPPGETLNMTSSVFVENKFYEPPGYRVADQPVGKLEWLKVGDETVWRAGDVMPVISAEDDEETKRWKRVVLDCHGLWPEATPGEVPWVVSPEEARRREKIWVHPPQDDRVKHSQIVPLFHNRARYERRIKWLRRQRDAALLALAFCIALLAGIWGAAS
ncbi:hypothetical protein [Hyphobacterium sp.]|uniref:hypothetical protein n=1 Tax=Hyphobacterium sp. TaxID=2004662 RepID=UPI003BACF30C